VLQRTTKLLIGKDISRDAQVVDGAVITTTAGSTGLADGEIVVLDKNFKVMAAGQTIDDTDTIYICQGTGSTFDYANELGTPVLTVRRLLFSDPIEGVLVKSYKGVSYSAIVEQVTTITPDTPVSGYDYVLRIEYKDMPHPSGQFTQTYRVTADGTNVDTNLIDLFLAKLAKHSGARVTGSGSTTLILTGKAIPEATTGFNDVRGYDQVVFTARIIKVSQTAGQEGQWIESGTVVYTTAASAGSGTWEQIRDMEKDNWAGRGFRGFNAMPYPYQTYPDQRVTVGGTYDLIVIEHDKSYLSPDNQYVKRAPLTTVIAFVVPTTGGQEENVLDALNSWMASLPKGFSDVEL
jgi:hypothetical protein